MQWATKRKVIIATIFAVLVLGFGVAMASFLFSESSSCSDNKQNRNEAGVDCGGSCPRFCSTQVQKPFVEFVQIVQDGDATAIVARLVNPNKRAEVRSLKYEAALFSNSGIFLEQFEGKVNIRPNEKTAVYLPVEKVVETEGLNKVSIELSGGIFLQDSGDSQNILIQDFTWSFSDGLPTLTLKVESLDQQVLRQPLIVVVYGEGEKVLGAKRVVVPEINEKEIDVFIRWTAPFSESPQRVEYFFE